MVQYIYDTGFSNQIQQFGLASAASVVMGFVLLVFTLVQLRMGRSSEYA
jgi:alpha-1,4-digalacturonate transport system permease protein